MAMGKTYDVIDERLAAWLRAQHVFFVATAPLSGDGHVNCSPKDAKSFRILGPHTVAYLDLTGSGAETLAHVKENGRLVLMFCAFEGGPKIVRLHGRGEVLETTDPKFADLCAEWPEAPPGVRSVIRLEVDRISDSCGYGVPLYRYEGERDQLRRWAERKGEAAVAEYRREQNAQSIDGLPAVTVGR